MYNSSGGTNEGGTKERNTHSERFISVAELKTHSIAGVTLHPSSSRSHGGAAHTGSERPTGLFHFFFLRQPVLSSLVDSAATNTKASAERLQIPG